MDYFVTTPSQLGKVLKGRRGGLQLTQKETGEKVGVLPKTVSAIENTPGGSTIDTFFKLLSALELELVLKPKEVSAAKETELEW
jgi:HTH-type transcriptional regulator / antitoxin HipB